MQWIYEYVHIPAGMTIDDLAADRDSISTSLTDEIVACNDPSRNARQALVTRWPKPKETMDAPAGAPLAGAATRSVAAQRDMARGRDEQARQVAHAEFDESISDDEEEGDVADPLAGLEYEDEKFNGFEPRAFTPPTIGGACITGETSFEEDTIIRVPVQIVPYSRELSGILGENNNSLLKILVECGLHIGMRVIEWCGNRVLQRPKALFKEGKFKKEITEAWNDVMLGEALKQKPGMTVRQTVDGIPKCTIDGPRSRIIIDNILKLEGFDLTQQGLRDGSVEYPSEFVEALAVMYRQMGDLYWVKWTLPLLAEALLDLAIGVNILFKRKLETQNQPARGARHLRRGVHRLAELFPGQISWYMWQLLGSVVQQLREHKVLGPHTQQTMEHINQLVVVGIKHGNNGAAVGRMSKDVHIDPSLKPSYMETRRSGKRSEAEQLWRRLLFMTMAKTKRCSHSHSRSRSRSRSRSHSHSHSQHAADPEISYGGALAIKANLTARGRCIEHRTFDDEWRVRVTALPPLHHTNAPPYCSQPLHLRPLRAVWTVLYSSLCALAANLQDGRRHVVHRRPGLSGMGSGAQLSICLRSCAPSVCQATSRRRAPSGTTTTIALAAARVRLEGLGCWCYYIHRAEQIKRQGVASRVAEDARRSRPRSHAHTLTLTPHAHAHAHTSHSHSQVAATACVAPPSSVWVRVLRATACSQGTACSIWISSCER